MIIPPPVREAAYSATLAAEPGWRDVVSALEHLLTERDISLTDSDRTLYIKFEFMNRRPSLMGVYGEPEVKLNDSPNRYNSNIYEVLEEALCPTIDENPMHYAMFKHEDNKWQAARVFDATKEQWNQWRDLRSQLKQDRKKWFEQLAVSEFSIVREIDLFILIEQQTGLNEVVPLLVGVEEKSVWMMTNAFSDRLNPYSGNNWAELPTCNAEVLYRCTIEQLGDAANSVEGLKNSLEVAAITQVAEAFYWQYVDGLKNKTEDPQVDFTKPKRHQTLSEYTGSAQALEKNTPFLLTRYKDKGQIPLSDGRQITPALVTVEGNLSSKLSPSVTTALKTATGSLGKAPTTFKAPPDGDLWTLLKEELAAHNCVKSPQLKNRMQSYAGLEFHYDRYLPDDFAPYLDEMSLAKLGTESLQSYKRAVKKHKEFDPNRHDVPVDVSKLPSLASLGRYKGLKTLNLYASVIEDLNWLETIESLETLKLNSVKVDDFSPLAHASGLKRLDLMQTQIKSLAPLSSLIRLESLDLFGVQVEDISPLSAIKSLRKLTLSHMPLHDISCLANLPELEAVLLAGIDTIKDYSVLSQLPNLKLLSIAETRIADLSVLPDMPKLETLYIWDCANLKDLSPLDRYKNLKPVNTKGTGVVLS